MSRFVLSKSKTLTDKKKPNDFRKQYIHHVYDFPQNVNQHAISKNNRSVRRKKNRAKKSRKSLPKSAIDRTAKTWDTNFWTAAFGLPIVNPPSSSNSVSEPSLPGQPHLSQPLYRAFHQNKER